MFQNANFPGSTPDPAGGAYSAPPDALADSEGSSSLLPSQEPYPCSRPFGPRFYRAVGLIIHTNKTLVLYKQNLSFVKKAVLSQGNRPMPQLFFSV